jgi:hypothetical protein
MASPVPASGSSSGSTSQGSSQNTSASSRRTRSVGTKLTDEEYAQLESLAAARGVTPGEWVRELALAAFPKTAGGKPVEATLAEQTVLSEVLALRTILINIIYDQANGHEIAPERMRELIAKADDGKVEKALERLKQNASSSPSAAENGR